MPKLYLRRIASVKEKCVEIFFNYKSCKTQILPVKVRYNQVAEGIIYSFRFSQYILLQRKNDSAAPTNEYAGKHFNFLF